MANDEKLKMLLRDVFLLEDPQIHFDLTREQIDTWDSLGTVSLAVGVQEVFGYHMTPDEANSLEGVRSLIRLLAGRGISIDG
jgi:acyl carrier protein